MKFKKSPIHWFLPHISVEQTPQLFTCPFHYTPHPLSVLAAHEVQDYLASRTDWQEELDKGKMFGVLVVEQNNRMGFLAAYSGLLCGHNDHDFFVPPVYDLLNPDGYFKTEENEISAINHLILKLENDAERSALSLQIKQETENGRQALELMRQAMKEAKQKRDLLRKSPDVTITEEQLIAESRFQKAEYKRQEKVWKTRIETLENALRVKSEEINRLKTERKQRSIKLQQWLFSQFNMRNAKGEEKDLWQIFKEYKQAVPPAGSGECAAPKLLQYAYLHRLRPVCMAEFWWGQSPAAEIHKHGYFYPACKNKCEPILSFMLQGLDVEPNEQDMHKQQNQELHIIYEDEWMLAIDKPAGMLSVPGKGDAPSVWSWAQKQYPEAEGPLVVHRLDMETSGVLLIAKNKEAHKMLQQLFESRQIKKRYIAILEKEVTTHEGIIRLPLCPNPDDRPRQMVHDTYGKPAVTRYEVLSRENGKTRVTFFPLTGRTHQLRVHAAHADGLNAPIVGDNLYGQRADRLYLHAESVTFRHFITHKIIQITSPIPF